MADLINEDRTELENQALSTIKSERFYNLLEDIDQMSIEELQQIIEDNKPQEVLW
jgi:hypothetical protein